MPEPKIENFLKELLLKTVGIPVFTLKMQRAGGGSINDSYRIIADNRYSFFLKSNKAAGLAGLFEKEKEGLVFLSSQDCIQIPRVIFCGAHNDNQLLLLNWIAPGNRNKEFWQKFGVQLARLHQCTHEKFGFYSDNYMGALPQQNTFTDNWIRFFTEYRILPQAALASRKNLLPGKYVDLFQQVCKKLDTIFNEESPSLLHGDLWNGNFICNERSAPVLIDPAVYYGHRSMDLAMTSLFGGFDPAFYNSYQACFPLPPNYREQWDICNLYPLLIHLNLFGQSYLPDITGILKRYG